MFLLTQCAFTVLKPIKWICNLNKDIMLSRKATTAGNN